MKRILLTGLIIIAGIALQAQPLRGPVREKPIWTGLTFFRKNQ